MIDHALRHRLDPEGALENYVRHAASGKLGVVGRRKRIARAHALRPFAAFSLIVRCTREPNS